MMIDVAETGKESGRLEELAALVAAGNTIRASAAELGLSERTAYRLSGSHEFRERVAALRSEVASAAVGRLTTAAGGAVDTLIALLNPEHDPKTRLDASKLILNSLGPLAEHGEFRSRLDSLERGE